MKQNNIKEKREKVIVYIKNNPNCTYKEISRNLKIKMERINWKMSDAFRNAGVPLSKNLKKRNLTKQKQAIIRFIKNNPKSTVTEIQNKTKTNIPRTFRSVLNAYKAAEVNYPKKEITDGVRNPQVISRCKKYETEIIETLAKIGKVKSKVKTPTGIIDCLFKYNNKTFVVEIKDFRSRNNITMSQIKQIIRYMKELKIDEGIIVCPKESFPKRKNSRNILLDNLKISIKSKEDLDKLK